MRKAIVLTLLSATSASAMPRLAALSMVETGDNDAAIGAAGEVSRFQIKPDVWRKYSPNPNYRNSGLAGVVAERVLADLEADFRRRAQREPSDFDRYVLWNAGQSYYARIGYSRTRVGRVVRDRAVRFANLCQMEPAASNAPKSTPPTTLTLGISMAGTNVTPRVASASPFASLPNLNSRPNSEPSQAAQPTSVSYRSAGFQPELSFSTGAQISAVLEAKSCQLVFPGFTSSTAKNEIEKVAKVSASKAMPETFGMVLRFVP